MNAAMPDISSTTTRQRDLGVLALALLAPIWGYGWVSIKVSLGYAYPFWFAALRTVLSAACLFLLMIATRRSLRPPAIGWVLAIGALQTTAFVGLTTWSLVSADAGKTSVITYTMPFWLLLLARLFLHDRLRGAQWLAAGVAFTGLVLVIAPWRGHGVLPSLLTLAAGFAWAASALLVKLLQRRRHVDLLTLTTWQLALGSLPLIVIAALVREPEPQWTYVFVANLAYLVLLTNVVAWLLWLFALRSLPAGAAGLGTLLIPVIGVFASWLQLGERPSASEGTGMALVVVGLCILALHGLLAGRREAAAAGEEPVVQPVTD